MKKDILILKYGQPKESERYEYAILEGSEAPYINVDGYYQTAFLRKIYGENYTKVDSCEYDRIILDSLCSDIEDIFPETRELEVGEYLEATVEIK